MIETLWTPPADLATPKKLKAALEKLATEAVTLEARSAATEALRPPERRHLEAYPLTDRGQVERLVQYTEARQKLAPEVLECRAKVDGLAEQLDGALAEDIAQAQASRETIIARLREQFDVAGLWPADAPEPRRGSPVGVLMYTHPYVEAADATIATLRAQREGISLQRQANLDKAIALKDEIRDLPGYLRAHRGRLKVLLAPPPEPPAGPPERRPGERPNPFR